MSTFVFKVLGMSSKCMDFDCSKRIAFNADFLFYVLGPPDVLSDSYFSPNSVGTLRGSYGK